MSIYTRASHGGRDWEKPAVYKITPTGYWWVTVKDQHGRYHTDWLPTHGEALAKAHRYAAGVFE